MKKILFVCSANTCRSPMALCIFKKILKDNKKSSEFLVSSAGINARINSPMNDNAISVLKEFKIPVVKFLSSQIDVKEINSSFLVITMTQEQKEFLSAFNNVKSIKEITNNSDIVDPFGQDIEVYRKVCEQLIKDLNIVYEKLVKEENLWFILQTTMVVLN